MYGEKRIHKQYDKKKLLESPTIVTMATISI